MRHYPLNSPQAAARIVALTLVADGHVCKAEFNVLEQRRAHDRLGLTKAELNDVVRDLCEDMLAVMPLAWAQSCRVGPDMLAALLADVDDPELRRVTLWLAMAVADADHLLHEGESIVLAAALAQWALVPEPHAGNSAAAPGCGRGLPAD